MSILSESWYLQSDVVAMAPQLLGKVIETRLDGACSSGIITETEAYAGIDDRASHAFGNRRTARTDTMYAKGGITYVYLCYGMHHLLNVVTQPEGIPHAILIRAIVPKEGIALMETRKGRALRPIDGIGPARVCQLLGIDRSHYGYSLQGPQIQIHDIGLEVPSHEIIAGPRIGVAYAGSDALLPYRFQWIKS